MRRRLQLLCFSCVFLFIVSLAEASIVYQAGVNDNFAPASDPSSPNANLTAAVTANANYQQNGMIGAFQDFDLTAGLNEGSKNTAVGHTFTALPTGISGATLEIRVRAGEDSWTESDQILFSFVQYDSSSFPVYSDYENYWVNSLAWFRSFGPRDYAYAPPGYAEPDDPGLLQSTLWTAGDEYLFSLDLAALPLVGGGTLSLINELNTFGFLDVVVEDETAVDFMTLTIHTTATPTTIPLPPSVFLLGCSLLGLVAFRRKYH